MAFPKVLVKVNSRIAAYGGVLYDYTQDKNIGKTPVEVELTSLIMKWIASGEVVVVEEPPQPNHDDNTNSEDWPEGMRLDVVDAFTELGIGPSDVRNMSDDEILSIRGIGNKTLKHIREVMG